VHSTCKRTQRIQYNLTSVYRGDLNVDRTKCRTRSTVPRTNRPVKICWLISCVMKKIMFSSVDDWWINAIPTDPIKTWMQNVNILGFSTSPAPTLSCWTWILFVSSRLNMVWMRFIRQISFRGDRRSSGFGRPRVRVKLPRKLQTTNEYLQTFLLCYGHGCVSLTISKFILHYYMPRGGALSFVAGVYPCVLPSPSSLSLKVIGWDLPRGGTLSLVAGVYPCVLPFSASLPMTFIGLCIIILDFL